VLDHRRVKYSREKGAVDRFIRYWQWQTFSSGRLANKTLPPTLASTIVRCIGRPGLPFASVPLHSRSFRHLTTVSRPISE
jgi:hypothetical protein